MHFGHSTHRSLIDIVTEFDRTYCIKQVKADLREMIIDFSAKIKTPNLPQQQKEKAFEQICLITGILDFFDSLTT